jgi:hypothetical protein
MGVLKINSPFNLNVTLNSFQGLIYGDSKMRRMTSSIGGTFLSRILWSGLVDKYGGNLPWAF